MDKINLNNIDSSKFNKVFDKKYVKYHRKELQNLYNEIFIFLKEEKLPLRLISPFMKQVEEYKRKRDEQTDIKNTINPYTNKVNAIEDQNKKYKRKNFRELIKNKYELKYDRLFYKYERFKNKIILKKIPYEIELPFIFYNCHINNKIHLSLRQSKERLQNSDYYYEGITTDLTEYIKKCRNLV